MVLTRRGAAQRIDAPNVEQLISMDMNVNLSSSRRGITGISPQLAE
jgi:hypothetical protein